MDHRDATRLGLTEKYVLGELSDAEAAEFEEHFFECPLCAEDVLQASRMAANLRAVLRAENTSLEIHRHHEFLDLTIVLRAPALSSVECELQSKGADPTFVVAQSAGKSVHLRLPVNVLPEGPCTLILRDKDSRGELERRLITISKNP